MAKRGDETAEVTRARWLYQGHEGPVLDGAISRMEWERMADPEWVRVMAEGLVGVLRE